MVFWNSKGEYVNGAGYGGPKVKNIFSSLFEWGNLKGRKEDYLTGGLVSVLQYVLESGSGYKEFGIDMLNSLLPAEVDFSFSSGEDIDIQAQRIYPESKGRRSIPDITVEPKDKKDKLVYIEDKVKLLNGEDIRRLKKYRNRLNEARRSGIKTGLVLITPSGKDDHRGLADRQISWLDVGKELEKLYYRLNQGEAKESMVMAYLANSFKEFIEEEIMYVHRLEDEINKSEMYKLIALLKIIEKACKDAGLMRPQLASELYSERDAWTGYLCDGKKYAVGVYVEDPLEDPLKVYFEIRQGNEVTEKFKDEEQVRKLFDPDAQLWEGNTILAVPLDLSDDFFALTKGEEQANKISQFIVAVLRKWEKSSKKLGR
jgi:hypothetical protein